MQEPAIFSSLLKAVLRQSGAEGAYLYQFENSGASARLVTYAGITPQADFSIVEGLAARGHYDRQSPLVIHREAWTDVRFGAFPEFWTHRFEGVASIPLLHEGSQGLLNLCRFEPASLTPGQADFLFALSLPFGALLAAGAENAELRQELDKVQQRLADRKLLDRAKGLLQAHFAWTEEEAYLHLRRESRQRRTAMREIAQEVIASGGTLRAEVRHAS